MIKANYYFYIEYQQMIWKKCDKIYINFFIK